MGSNGVSLKQRDYELLLACYEERAVTIQQASSFIWQSRSAANRRLAQLEGKGLIRRQYDCPQRGDTLIRPTTKTATALNDAGLASSGTAWSWKELYQRTPGHLTHESMVAEYRFRCRQACQLTGGRVQLRQCRCGPAAADEFIDPDDGQRRCLRPDRYMEFRLAGQRGCSLHYFLEVDRGTKPVQRSRGFDVVGQLERYARYLRSERCGDRFGEARDEDAVVPFRVLFVTSSWERVQNIIGALYNTEFPFRSFSVHADFLADPLGRVLIREIDGQRCRLVDNWPFLAPF